MLVSELRARLANQPVTVATDCNGPTCTTRAASALLGTELALSVSDLGYADEDGSGNARYEAIASHRGVSVAQGSGVTTFSRISVERYGFGGWLDHSFFVVESGEVTDGPTLLVGGGIVVRLLGRHCRRLEPHGDRRGHMERGDGRDGRNGRRHSGTGRRRDND